MGIHIVGQIDLGPRHVQKTQRIIRGQLARFRRVNYIVWNTRYSVCPIDRRTQRLKRTNDCH
jgi:hypothetical protein